MKVVLLCGGRGIRLAQHTSFIPKGLVKVAHRPVIWHIMKRYALAGHKEFILALGDQGEQIRNYFLNYTQYVDDVTVSLGSGKAVSRTHHQEADWNVTMVDTGSQALSGARIDRIKTYVGDDFMVTYSDCLADVDIDNLLAFHKKSKKIATVTGVLPQYREGDFIVRNNAAVGIYDTTKPIAQKENYLVNAGFMVFNKKIFSYLTSFNECKLESDVFSKLIADKELSIYPHSGFWRWLDTDRDYAYINNLVETNKMYWLQE